MTSYSMNIFSQCSSEVGMFHDLWFLLNKLINKILSNWIGKWRDLCRMMEILPNAKFESQDRQRFKKRFSNQFSSSASRFNKDRVYNPKPQGRNCGSSYVDWPNCIKCCKKHDGKCLVGTHCCYKCGKRVYTMRDCPCWRF